MKKQFTLDIGDEEIILECNFRQLEIIERVYEMNADYVVLSLLQDSRNMLRSKISEVISLWCAGKSLHYKQSDIRELVTLAPVENFKIYIAAMQAVVLFTTRQITEPQFDTLLNGEDLILDDDKNEDGEDEAEDELSYLDDEESEEKKL